jgi:hypothetical protein
MTLFLGLVLTIGPGSVSTVVSEETHDSHAQVEHSNADEHSEGTHETSHGEEHGGGHGEHLWWTFPGYEIVISLLSCFYFAMFIIIIPRLFGKDLEGHH